MAESRSHAFCCAGSKEGSPANPPALSEKCFTKALCANSSRKAVIGRQHAFIGILREGIVAVARAADLRQRS